MPSLANMRTKAKEADLMNLVSRLPSLALVPSLVLVSSLALSASAEFALDRLINHEWKTNLKVKVRGEGERRTISFRGFRGRYRLTWKDADGRPCSKVVELK